MSQRNHKRVILSIIALAACAGAYLAADRYLIRHVEITDVAAYAASASALAEDETAPSSSAVEQETVASDAESMAEAITYDDWNYRSSALSISISQHSSGSGSNALAWFVADVILSDAAQLQSAFADDQFGRNIIAYTSEIAAEHDAVFAVNGDYYGFRSDGIIIRDGVIYRDEPARVGLAFYQDGSLQVYDETQTTAEELLAAGVRNTLSFGPALLDDGEITANLANVEIDTNFGNHPIQGNQPRTGVGMLAPNHFVFIVVDGRSKGYSIGVTLVEFAQMFRDLGCTEAYNLDGGGSSVMVFMDRVVNNPLGRNKERGTSDILYIGADA
jgi:Exopolysaccharide biosynthesis protein related to N-acetylglucosamine-1-phosphodiester alpha-N-acetylglucosaminidase